MNLYAVTQMNHGAEHRWIFSEEDLVREVSKYSYDDGPIPNEDEINFWPIGGSNCGPSHICKLDSEEEIYEFLTSPGSGPDSDDPELVDLAEYYYAADIYDQWYWYSSTGYFVEQFGLTQEQTEGHDDCLDIAKQMIAALKEAGYEDFDYRNPFYGDNSSMRYSELSKLYKKVVEEDEDDD